MRSVCNRAVLFDDIPRHRFCDLGVHTPLLLVETPNFLAWVKVATTIPPAIMATIPPELATG